MNPPDTEEPFITNHERQAKELAGVSNQPGQNPLDLMTPGQEISDDDQGNPKSSIMVPKIQNSDKMSLARLNSNQYQTVAFSKDSGTEGRNWGTRTFTKYTNATLRSAIMTLLNTAKGVGCLSIPLAYSYVGFVPGTIILTIAAVNMIYTFYMMNRVQIRNPDCKLYGDLVEKILGKGQKLFLESVFCFYLFGSLISYHLTANQFFMNEFGPMIAGSFNITRFAYDNETTNDVYWFKKILS
jgi:hypothetical protein